MSERPVNLDLSTNSSGMRDAWTAQQQSRSGADEEARRQFEAALHAPEEQPGDAPPAAPAATSVSSLLLQAGASSASLLPKRDLPLLRSTLSSVLVGDGQDGRRQVGMQLADDVLPGVILSVYEEGGAWVADFVCGNDDSRRLLSDEGAQMAQEWADALGRRAGWRVMTDDTEDLRLCEFWADPSR